MSQLTREAVFPYYRALQDHATLARLVAREALGEFESPLYGMSRAMRLGKRTADEAFAKAAQAERDVEDIRAFLVGSLR